MKKYIISFALLLAGCFTSMAQESALADIHDGKTISSSNEVIEFEPLTSLRFGVNVGPGSDFLSSNMFQRREFAFNAFEFKINPAEWLSLVAGLDLKFDTYVASAGYKFIIDSDGYIPAPEKAEIKKSKLNLFSLTVPLLVDFKLGNNGGLRVGTEPIFSLSAKTKEYTAVSGSDKSSVVKVKGGKPQGMVWTGLAELYFNEFGVYYRYCPKSLIKNGFELTPTHTVGIVLGI